MKGAKFKMHLSTKKREGVCTTLHTLAMPSSIVVALAALLPHTDKETRLKILISIVTIITQENCTSRVFAVVPKVFRRRIAYFLIKDARSPSSGINRPSISPIKSMIVGGHEKEFRQMFPYCALHFHTKPKNI